LVETKAAAERLAEIVTLKGIDEIHIGLNDLAISAGYPTIFEPFCNGELERLSGLARSRNIAFGVGGVTSLTLQGLPLAPEIILAEQIRLGAEVAWLSRSFSRALEHQRSPGKLAEEISRLRHAITRWENASAEEFRQNREALFGGVKAWKAALGSHA
jgi:hypothetical protein